MTALIPFLVFCQAFGASVGTFTAVWGEFVYIRALRDGRVDVAERAHLNVVARGLRFGMTLLLLASFGLVVTAFVLQAKLQPVLTSTYWVLIMLSLLIIGVTRALSRHHISFALGSAITFTAWWFLTYLTIGLLPALSFGATTAFFIIATALFYLLLHYGRSFARH